MTKTCGNGEQFRAAVLTKIHRARFRNASKHIEINMGVLRNQDVTKTRRNNDKLCATVLTKKLWARFRNTSKSTWGYFEIKMWRKRAEAENFWGLRSLQRTLQYRRNQHGGTSKRRRDENTRKRTTVWGCGPYKERFKIGEINMRVFRNRDVTKTRGNGELSEAVLLVKIPSAQMHKRSKMVEIHVETVKIKMRQKRTETENFLKPCSL